MPELDINQPSTRQMQQIIKEKSSLEIKLVTGDVFNGQLTWQDTDYFCLLLAGDKSKIVINRSAVVYIKPQGA
jgi:host factor-I protein